MNFTYMLKICLNQSVNYLLTEKLEIKKSINPKHALISHIQLMMFMKH